MSTAARNYGRGLLGNNLFQEQFLFYFLEVSCDERFMLIYMSASAMLSMLPLH
jgi:hypothetical protein